VRSNSCKYSFSSQRNPRPYLVIPRMQPLRAALDQAGVFQRFDVFVHARVVVAEGAGVELVWPAHGVEHKN
jgi:hypothetical protein